MLEIAITEKRFVATDGSPLTAIRDLSFRIEDGEFVCLIGPSGCGKTTTMRIILGLDNDFAGSVTFDPREDCRVGMMFQEPVLLPWRTVEQNVRLALPKAARTRNIDALFDTLGLSQMGGFFPRELSLGLARRVAMARAFAVEPSLLMLDEPFMSLDEETAQRLRGLLLAVWRARPTSVLMVTHNLREAVELADRIILLTPRPGTIRGIVPITEARGARDPQTVAAIVDEISSQYPGLV
jgi:NitT/TauT family transport system ATP-binding protein